MKKLLLLLFIAAPVSAQSVTPQFTQGSMSSTTTTSTDIQRTIAHEVYGGAVTSWSGNNVTASGDISDTATTYSISDTSLPWQLEIVEKSAGIIETIDITEDVTQSSTTTSLSVFSQ